MRITTVRHPDGYANTHLGIAIAPVGHRLRNEIRVRHNHGYIITGHHHGAAQADFLHPTGNAAYLNAVTNGNGLFGKDDYAADKVIDNILQSKTHTHTNAAGNDGQRTEIDPHNLERHVETNNQKYVAKNPSNAVLEGLGKIGLVKNTHDNALPNNLLGNNHRNKQQAQYEQTLEGQVTLAHFDKRVGKDFFDDLQNTAT